MVRTKKLTRTFQIEVRKFVRSKITERTGFGVWDETERLSTLTAKELAEKISEYIEDMKR